MPAANLRGWVGLVILALCATGRVTAQGEGHAPGTDKLPAAGTVSSAPPFSMALPPQATEAPTASGHEGIAADSPADSWGGFFADAEYLLMRPRRRAFDFVIVDPTNNGIPQGSIESLEWEYESGVRVGGGYRLPAEGWEMGVFYTYLHSSASRTIASPEGGTLFATLTHPGTIEQVDAASANSRIRFNVLDVEMSRTVSVLHDAGCLRFFGGGRYAWINQSLNAVYDGGDADNAEVHSPVDFNGGGLRVGGEGSWGLGHNLSVFARASGSLLVGNFKTSLVETNHSGATTLVNVTDNFDRVVPVTEIGLGLAWQWHRITVSAGYELANWFNMVDSPDFVDDVHQGKLGRRTSDLSLDGFMVRLEMGF